MLLSLCHLLIAMDPGGGSVCAWSFSLSSLSVSVVTLEPLETGRSAVGLEEAEWWCFFVVPLAGRNGSGEEFECSWSFSVFSVSVIVRFSHFCLLHILLVLKFE